MPLLIPPVPPESAEVRPFWGDEVVAVAQGEEGRQLHHQIADVSRHWREQSLAANAPATTDLLDELNQYRPIPFAQAGQVQARFTSVSKLQPSVYSLEEDVE